MPKPQTPNGSTENKALNRLTLWLGDEREKITPDTERWRTLADVTTTLHKILEEVRGGAPETRIEFGTILSHRTKQGMVEFLLNGERAQMDLDKAREVHGMLGSAIEAAVSDTLIYKFLTEKVGLDEHKAGAALLDFRELRQGSRSAVYPQ